MRGFLSTALHTVSASLRFVGRLAAATFRTVPAKGDRSELARRRLRAWLSQTPFDR